MVKESLLFSTSMTFLPSFQRYVPPAVRENGGQRVHRNLNVEMVGSNKVIKGTLRIVKPGITHQGGYSCYLLNMTSNIVIQRYDGWVQVNRKWT